MKLLLDQNISYKIIKKLDKFFEEVAQVGRLGMAQTDDGMIWQYARTNNYVLVTFDPYFQERNIVAGHPLKIIWLKCRNTSTKNLVQVLTGSVEEIKAFYEDPELTCLEIFD